MDSYTFDSPDADLILRSNGSDPAEFRVHRCILSMASPVFNTMFSLPQSKSVQESLPVVDMSEDRTALDALLRMIYPILDPPFETLDELGPVINAAMKYDITFVLARLRLLLVSPRFLETQPLRVYAISTHWEFEEEMKLASGHTLGVDIINSPSADILNNISASHYRRLLIFHLERAAKAQHLLEQVPPKQATCSACRGFVERWHEIYKIKAKDELSTRPTSTVICSLDFIAPIADSIDVADCGMSSCRRGGRKLEVFRLFLQTLKTKIDALPTTI
jgi:hypothetical protein